jgi:hypothetical protein
VAEEDLNKLAAAWIRYHAPNNSEEREETAWATIEELDLLFDGKSEELWQIILKIHERRVRVPHISTFRCGYSRNARPFF